MKAAPETSSAVRHLSAPGETVIPVKTGRQRWASLRLGGRSVVDRGGQRRLPSRLAASVVMTVAVGSAVSLPEAGASAQSSHRLVGTFKITAGSCNPITKTVAGSYFRLIFPKSNILFGPFFQNSTSPCFDKSYTTVSPGTQGGLVTGAFQPGPPRAFAANGDARAQAIIRPVPFAAVGFSLTTQSTDPQTRRAVPVPSITTTGGRLSGNLEAVSAAWKNIYFNQGSPKPGGRRPGLTVPVSGRYSSRTRGLCDRLDQPGRRGTLHRVHRPMASRWEVRPAAVDTRFRGSQPLAFTEVASRRIP